MTFANPAAAIAAYQAAQPWNGSIASAQAALQAVEYLLMNRGVDWGDQGSTIRYESLGGIRDDLVKFLGASTPRAFGRSRRVTAATHPAGVQ